MRSFVPPINWGGSAVSPTAPLPGMTLMTSLPKFASPYRTIGSNLDMKIGKKHPSISSQLLGQDLVLLTDSRQRSRQLRLLTTWRDKDAPVVLVIHTSPRRHRRLVADPKSEYVLSLRMCCNTSYVSRLLFLDFHSLFLSTRRWLMRTILDLLQAIFLYPRHGFRN